MSDSSPSSAPAPAVDTDSPSQWLFNTPLLDLEDPRLRVRAHSLTQLCKSEREAALAIYGFVKRMPFTKRFKTRLHTPREVMDAGRGDVSDKAVLIVALMRLAGIPARLRYIEVRGEIMRGLTSSVSSPSRPQLEVWLTDRWVATDTFIFDALYMAAARQRLQDSGWEWGFGLYRDGHTLWDGAHSAYLAGVPPEEDPLMLADLGVFHDPLQFTSSRVYKDGHPRVARAFERHVLAPLMDRVVRDLREEYNLANGAGPSPAR